MLKFSYGFSDFYLLKTENYFYVDRTSHISLIEEAGLQLLFLRPRRFGKSLLLSMLENYYDVTKADEFEKLFGDLAIGQNPTPKHNQYFFWFPRAGVGTQFRRLSRVKVTLAPRRVSTPARFLVPSKAWEPSAGVSMPSRLSRDSETGRWRVLTGFPRWRVGTRKSVIVLTKYCFRALFKLEMY
jgi:hypothetical protein